jgi:hypothetical protein
VLVSRQEILLMHFFYLDETGAPVPIWKIPIWKMLSSQCG